MTINELCKKAHENAVKKGFWEDWESIQWFIKEACLDDKHENVTEEFKENLEEMFSTAQMFNNAVGNRFMLIVSEIGEAEEALRHNDIANLREELADAVIRICDLAGGLEMDLEAEIERKMKINETRPYKHGKQF